jgi:hypothetical protein
LGTISNNIHFKPGADPTQDLVSHAGPVSFWFSKKTRKLLKMANNSSYLNTIICLGSLHKNAVQHWIQGPFFLKFISGYCHNDSSVNIKLRLKTK